MRTPKTVLEYLDSYSSSFHTHTHSISFSLSLFRRQTFFQTPLEQQNTRTSKPIQATALKLQLAFSITPKISLRTPTNRTCIQLSGVTTFTLLSSWCNQRYISQYSIPYSMNRSLPLYKYASHWPPYSPRPPGNHACFAADIVLRNALHVPNQQQKHASRP